MPADRLTGMGILYRGPDATDPADLVTLGQGDARWAGAVDLSTLQSDVANIKTNEFGSSSRTKRPYCEVRLGTAYTNGANADTYAGTGWNLDSSSENGMFFGGNSSSGIGYYNYARIRLPVAGRWFLDFQAVSAGTAAHNVGVKIMAQTGTNKPTVGNNSIASWFGPAAASVEGGPAHCWTHERLDAGVFIYWATFRTTAGQFKVNNFGGIKTKMQAIWMGP